MDVTLNNLDQIAFELIENIQVSEVEKSIPLNMQLDHIRGIPQIAHLGEVSNLVHQTNDHYGNIVSMSISKDGVQIGFGIEKFKVVKNIASAFLEIENNSMFADTEFIEKEIFNWIIDVRQEKVAKYNLTTYLEKRISEEANEYLFYFKLLSIGIKDDIEIGDVKIFEFSEEYFKKQYTKLNKDGKLNFERYEQSLSGLRGAIVASIKIKAVPTKAETLAKSETVLAINALKLFLSAESMAPHIQIFDLDFKASNIIVSTTAIQTEDNINIRQQRIHGITPIIINHDMKVKMLNKGLDEISQFLKESRNNEFHILLVQAIDQYGILISIRNLHERVISLVSFFELFLNSDSNSRSKAQTYLKTKIIPSIIATNDVEIFIKMANRIYTIRDKYIHNRISLPIDIDDFSKVQSFAFEFLKRLIRQRDKLTTKREFYQRYNIPY
ncbi:MAG: hypothetical protein NVSMB24_14070 [Mucilaginibacter sp.]